MAIQEWLEARSGPDETRWGGRVQKLREEARLSQSELARRIETTPQNISYWETKLENPPRIRPQHVLAGEIVDACGVQRRRRRDAIAYLLDDPEYAAGDSNPEPSDIELAA